MTLTLEKQALTPFIFSLFKAIVGSGILSLANSIARWTDNPALILPVCALSVTPTRARLAWPRCVCPALARARGREC